MSQDDHVLMQHKYSSFCQKILNARYCDFAMLMLHLYSTIPSIIIFTHALHFFASDGFLNLSQNGAPLCAFILTCSTSRGGNGFPFFLPAHTLPFFLSLCRSSCFRRLRFASGTSTPSGHKERGFIYMQGRQKENLLHAIHPDPSCVGPPREVLQG